MKTIGYRLFRGSWPKSFALSLLWPGFCLRAVAWDNVILRIASFFVKLIHCAPKGIAFWRAVRNQQLRQFGDAVCGSPSPFRHARPNRCEQLVGLLRRPARTRFRTFALGGPPSSTLLPIVPGFEFALFQQHRRARQCDKQLGSDKLIAKKIDWRPYCAVRQ